MSPGPTPAARDMAARRATPVAAQLTWRVTAITARFMDRVTTRITAVLPCLLLAACAGYSPAGLAPGAGMAEAERQMGPRTGEHTRPGGGRRLEFARGPMGRHTYMLDFDANGRLVASEQVLTEAHFAQIEPGQTRDAVLQRIGRPSHVMWIQYQKRHIWSYRYDAVFCQWFQVGIDTEGRVVDAGYGPDPICDVDEHDW